MVGFLDGLQAVAAAQAGARLISPFPGRVKDYISVNVH
jgi:transaldolase